MMEAGYGVALEAACQCGPERVWGQKSEELPRCKKGKPVKERPIYIFSVP